MTWTLTATGSTEDGTDSEAIAKAARRFATAVAKAGGLDASIVFDGEDISRPAKVAERAPTLPEGWTRDPDGVGYLDAEGNAVGATHADGSAITDPDDPAFGDVAV